MKTEAIVSCMLAVVLGSVSAVVTSLYVQRQSPASVREAAALIAAPAPGPESELHDRVRELGIENRELRERLAAIELRGASASRAAVVEGVSQEDFEAFKQEISDRIAATQGARVGAGNLEAQVADVLQSIRKQETLETIRQSQEKRARALEDRLARLSRDLGLDNHQVRELRSIFTTQMERNRELTRLWAEGADSQALGEAKRIYAVEDRAAIERTLTPQQLETYRSTWRSAPAKRQ